MKLTWTDVLLTDIIAAGKPIPVVDVCILFKDNDRIFVLIEANQSWVFVDPFNPLSNKYKGKKRNVVIQAAMRDHVVYAARSHEEYSELVKQS